MGRIRSEVRDRKLDPAQTTLLQRRLDFDLKFMCFSAIEDGEVYTRIKSMKKNP